jgi:hypothetical protein
MFRKTTLALAAATVVATAAIPTSASAYHGWGHSGWGHHHRHGLSVRIGTPYPYYAYGPRCYTVKKWVHTRWGWQRVKVRRCH